MSEYKPGGIKVNHWSDDDMEYLDRKNLLLEKEIASLKAMIAEAKPWVEKFEETLEVLPNSPSFKWLQKTKVVK